MSIIQREEKIYLGLSREYAAMLAEENRVIDNINPIWSMKKDASLRVLQRRMRVVERALSEQLDIIQTLRSTGIIM